HLNTQVRCLAMWPPVSYGFVRFFFSRRRRDTRFSRDWSSDVCSSDLPGRAHPLPGLDVPEVAGGVVAENRGGQGAHERTSLTARSEERRAGKECGPPRYP